MTGKPIRVLYCENNIDGTIGGSHYSLLYLVKGLDRTRYQPVVVFYIDHSLVPEYRAAGIEVHVWNHPKSYWIGAEAKSAPRWLRRPFVLARNALNLVSTFLVPTLARAWFLIQRNIRIVHLNNTVLAHHDWMLAARLTGRTCLTHERGINDDFPRLAKYFGRHLDAVICISDAVRENMQRCGADFGNLVTIHNGLDPAMMGIKTSPGALRAAHGIADNDQVICMIGNIKPWKGQDTLVRAMDVVRRACPAARCILVGATASAERSYEDMLRGLVDELGLHEHVIFAGYQRNVADYLAMCDVMVHASVQPEPFGRVILEAMACRKPVIGSRAGAIPEIIVEGKTGLTFPPGDADALACAIVTVLSDREEAQRMGNRGYDRLVREFHIDRNVDATQRTYARLLSETA